MDRNVIECFCLSIYLSIYLSICLSIYLPVVVFYVLRATTACTFSSLIWPAGSAPAALASLLFDPPEPQIIGKTQCFATFLPFRASASSFFWLFLFSDLLSSNHSFLSASALLCFSSVHAFLPVPTTREPSIYLSICLSVHLSMYLCVYRPIYVSICLSIYRSIYLSIYLSLSLSISLSIYLSVYLSLHVSIYVSIDVSIYLSVYRSVCLSVCLSV